MYNVNYMDGVPVKIAEKYKPPPPIYKLPQSLANKLNLEDNYYEKCPAFAYDFQLEKRAQSKIEEWSCIRQRDKGLRKERVSRRELQRKHEDEDRQKNLLCSVSYPSTDDLSSGNEEENDKTNLKSCENGTDILESKEICVTETASNFHNILQPTILSYNSNSNTSDSSGTMTAPNISSLERTLPNSFNYKDFEDDTSSPFDNIELKTINDLDVLAQILHNTQLKSTTNEILNDNVLISPINLNEAQPEQDVRYNTVVTSTENIPKPNSLPRFDNYNYNYTQSANTKLKENHTISASPMYYNANLPGFPLTPQHNYNIGLHKSTFVESPLQYHRLQAVAEDQVTKSKSVPDIIKELRDEIRNSEIRRYRNCSFNMEESTQNTGIEACLANESTTKINENIDTNDIFNKLDSKGQQLVEQISAMGFPQQRVARIVNLVGADDKMVIEHLIPLSELADLGFEECKISDALIRNENNKNKALDELIS